MQLDKEKVDREFRIIQLLKELTEIPGWQKSLERYVTTNGASAGAARSTTTHQEDGQNPTGVPKRGKLRYYALQVVSSTPQTVKQITEQMVAKGFKSRREGDLEVLVAEGLRNMAKNGEATRRPEKGAFGASLWTK
jgi:hypothetical protein